MQNKSEILVIYLCGFVKIIKLSKAIKFSLLIISLAEAKPNR